MGFARPRIFKLHLLPHNEGEREREKALADMTLLWWQRLYKWISSLVTFKIHRLCAAEKKKKLFIVISIHDLNSLSEEMSWDPLRSLTAKTQIKLTRAYAHLHTARAHTNVDGNMNGLLSVSSGEERTERKEQRWIIPFTAEEGSTEIL